jgi:hypothetical protein
MDKLYHVSFLMYIALDTFSVGAPIDRIKNWLGPLGSLAEEVLFERFRRRVVLKCFVVMTYHCPRWENQVHASPLCKARHSAGMTRDPVGIWSPARRRRHSTVRGEGVDCTR